MTKRQKFLSSKQWKTLRSQILDRDGHKCCLCGCKDRLQVHHILFEKFYPDHLLEPLNCITICTRCHWLIHKSSFQFKLYDYLQKNRSDQFNFVLDHV